MLNRLIPVILINSCAFLAYSQAEIAVGKPYKVVDAQGKFYFYKDNELLTVKKDDDRLYIQKLNTGSLSYVGSKMSYIPQEGFEGIKEINNRYFLFNSDGNGLFVREIDFKSGSTEDRGKRIIVESRAVGSSTVFGPYGIPDKNSSKYNIYTSNDESLVLIQYRLKPETRDDSKNHESIGLHIFDSNLGELSSSRLEMPYTEVKMNNLAYSIDSKGNVYIVTSVVEDVPVNKNVANPVRPNYHLEILKVTQPSDSFTTARLEVEGNFIKTLKLYENPKGFMSCVGFYNKGRKSDNVDGIIQFKLNSDGKPHDFETYEVPLEILNQFVNKKTTIESNSNEPYNREGLENLNLRETIFNKDGSMLIVGEQASTEIRYNQYNAPSTVYSDGDLLVAKIDSVSKMSWIKKLPKGQISGNAGDSFYYLAGKEEHHFVFLDKMKNFELPLNKKHSANHGSGDILMAYSVNNKTGEVKKTAILDLRNVQGTQLYQFTPNRIQAISSTAFVFEAYKKNNEDVLIKVDLPK